jgi:hypothetical protein
VVEDRENRILRNASGSDRAKEILQDRIRKLERKTTLDGYTAHINKPANVRDIGRFKQLFRSPGLQGKKGNSVWFGT